eukprot:scaffold23606_cov69-Phaeocystis_antarctica.AAC.3
MAQLKFADLSRSVRAVWAEFGATVRGLCRLVILFFDRSRQDDRFDASSERLDPKDNRRSSSLAHPPFALIAAQPSAPAPLTCTCAASKPTMHRIRTHSARAGPHPVPEHARSPLPPLAAPGSP